MDDERSLTPPPSKALDLGVDKHQGPTSADFNPYAFGSESCLGGQSVEDVYAKDTAGLGGVEKWPQAVQTLKDVVLSARYAVRNNLGPNKLVSSPINPQEALDLPGFNGVKFFMTFARMNDFSRPRIFPHEPNPNPQLSGVDALAYQDWRSDGWLAHDIHLIVAGGSAEGGFETTMNPDTLYMAAHQVLQKGEANPYALTGAQLKDLTERFDPEAFAHTVTPWADKRISSAASPSPQTETLTTSPAVVASVPETPPPPPPSESSPPPPGTISIGGELYSTLPKTETPVVPPSPVSPVDQPSPPSSGTISIGGFDYQIGPTGK